jgi:hypothetical protein
MMPFGRRSKTKIKIKNAEKKTKELPRYIKIIAKIIPRVNPPTTAPTRLSIPPMTAATKPKTSSKLNSNASGVTDPEPFTVCNIPAVAPAAPEIAHPRVRIKSTRIPDSREISGANEAARKESPKFVRWKTRVITEIMAFSQTGYWLNPLLNVS